MIFLSSMSDLPNMEAILAVEDIIGAILRVVVAVPIVEPSAKKQRLEEDEQETGSGSGSEEEEDDSDDEWVPEEVGLNHR